MVSVKKWPCDCYLLDGFRMFVVVFRVDDLEGGKPEKFLFFVSVFGASRRIGGDDDSIEIEDDEDVGDRLEDSPISILARPQGFLSLDSARSHRGRTRRYKAVRGR